MKISKIKIGSRFRKDMGDIQELADSIQKQGLLQSIGVNEKNELIFGLRRIEAVKLLGWENIDAKVVNVTSLIEGEITENEVRKDFSLDEKVAIGKMIEQQLGERRGGDRKSNNFQNQSANIGTLKTRDIVAQKIGFGSHGNYEKAKIISEKANDEIKDKLNKNNISISQAYNETKNGNKKENIKKQKEQNKQILDNTIKTKPKIFNKNCVDFLNSIEDKSQDLLITDPPYLTDLTIDINEFLDQWLFLALNKIKDTGRIYICTGAYPQEQKAYLTKLLSQHRFIIDNSLIWTYRNTLGKTPSMKYNLNYQVIYHLYTKNSYPLNTEITNEMFNVQDINAPDGWIGNRFYKFQKPTELARRLITHSTKEYDNIIDCFAGSGTFLIIGTKLKRYCIGCDNSVDALNIAKELGCEQIG